MKISNKNFANEVNANYSIICCSWRHEDCPLDPDVNAVWGEPELETRSSEQEQTVTRSAARK